MVKKTETQDVVKGLDELAQNLEVKASVIFKLIGVKGVSESKQQQPCYFCNEHFFDSC